MRRIAALAAAVTLAAGATAALPAEDEVAQRLAQSPRHHEWVEIADGERVVRTFVAYPEVAEPVPAIVVIHENRGLTDWVRGLADQLAEAGYVAVAPDLLSGTGPGGGGTASFADSDAAREGIYALDQERVTADLHAVADWAAEVPAADGTVAVAGFCWGGRQSFLFATAREDLAAAFVFYGTAPGEEVDLAAIEAPVYGFYGGDDARVTATVEATAERMEAAGGAYHPETYEGAGHGFMRTGEAADAAPADREAREAAWQRWKELLAGL